MSASTSQGKPPGDTGNPPARAALLIIDMLNCFDFPGAESLESRARHIVPAIEFLIRQFDGLGYPVIYVNDNFGEWHSDRSASIDRALAKHNPVAEKLRPRENDYFILKPQFSGFYATNLQVLLPKLGVTRLVLTGIAADICILFTAADAHMRDYTLWIPADAVAGEDDSRQKWALEIVKASMNARIEPTGEMAVSDWQAFGQPG